MQPDESKEELLLLELRQQTMRTHKLGAARSPSPVRPAVAAAAAVSAPETAAASAAPSCASAPSSPARSPSSASSWPPAAGFPRSPEVDPSPGWAPPPRLHPRRGEGAGWRPVVVTFPPHPAPVIDRDEGTIIHFASLAFLNWQKLEQKSTNQHLEAQLRLYIL